MKRCVTFVISKWKFLQRNAHISAINAIRLTHSNTENIPRNKGSLLINQLQSRIKINGPMTVAEYMREVLINPVSGYYMQKDVFGEEGDFITSPEISQLFGEMISVWILNEWEKIGMPKPLQIIELGPGRGTLSKDILKILGKYIDQNNLSLHLVEISPFLSKVQGKNLCNSLETSSEENAYQSGKTANGISVSWYQRVEEVPKAFSCILAHEFFDALPIHKFQKIGEEWKEILIDLDPANEDKLRYIISKNSTPASKYFIKKDEKRDHFEVSPQSGVIIEHLASRIKSHGGFALIADYGHDGNKTDTFRGFCKHKLHDPLIDPGTADLTADVDFSYLRSVANDTVLSFGPVSQGIFLKRLGIDYRLQILLRKAKTEEQKQNLLSGYNMITSSDQMGERFKFFAMFPEVLKDHLKKHPVAGFHDIFI